MTTPRAVSAGRRPMAPSRGAAWRSRSWRRLARVLLALAFLAGAGRQLGGYLPAFAAWVGTLGAWAPLIFVGAYALATVAFVPGSILTLAAGATFGLVAGTAYVLAGATAGAAAAFLIARYAARGAVERKIAANPRFSAIDRAVERQGRKLVFLLRLSPVFPFNLLNYALGLTKVRFVDYLVASAGMLPGTLLYVYYGKVAGEVAAAASGAAPARGVGYYAVTVAGLLATIAVAAVVARLARKALQEVTESD